MLTKGYRFFCDSACIFVRIIYFVFVHKKSFEFSKFVDGRTVIQVDTACGLWLNDVWQDGRFGVRFSF
jgi:hypothetical protein